MMVMKTKKNQKWRQKEGRQQAEHHLPRQSGCHFFGLSEPTEQPTFTQKPSFNKHQAE